MKMQVQYTRREEAVNAATHGLGVLLAIAGSVIMIVLASRLASGTAIVSSLIYGLSMVLLYTIGVIFYKMKQIKYMHGVWHLFVLAGSILHYLCILRFIMHA